ncbi:unnamed protein product [Urochloa decumbens]|uniref:Uncharacterized protein n=1 Tax=Urochloa decumbens TaxID=240449 RepID=A0ABC9EQP0_9POAL
MGMAIAETAARKLLHGGGDVARGVAGVGVISFGLWDLVTGFFANILANLLAALAGLAHLLVLPLELLWQWLVTAAGAIGSGIDGLWQHVTGFFEGILAAISGAPHLLVLPLEKLWQWLATAAADAAGAVSSGIDGLWEHVMGFFAGIFTSIAAAAHQLVLPLETLWQWLATSTADAVGAISSGLDGLWHLATGFFPKFFAHISAALGGAAHELARQVESLWQWLVTAAAAAAGAISFHLDALWQLVTGFFPKISAALAVAAHELPKKLDELWRWLKAAAAVALPFVLAAAAVLLLVALVWFCWPVLCAAAVGACKVLVYALSYLGQGLYHVAVALGGALSCLLPPGARCLSFCAAVTMKAPGAGGMVISRAAFDAAPALYFQILRTAGSVVAAAVFCTGTVARLLAAPVAALFRGGSVVVEVLQ